MTQQRPYFVTWAAQKAPQTLSVKRSEGPYMVLEDGRKLLDMVSTSYQTSFGHSEKRILDSVRSQLDQMCVVTPKAEFELKTTQTERLLKLINLGGGKIFYTVSGAESVENALKIARQIKGRKIVLARKVSYHGATLGALSVTGDWRNPPHATVSDWTVRIPEPAEDPDCARTREIILKTGADKIAAVIVETITAANGVIIPPRSWWAGMQKLCKEFGILLICDEVADGFGRCGAPFAFQLQGIKPDMVCMAKAISGGYVPFGALWVSDALSSYYDEKTLVAGLTSYGHPLGLAAMKGVLDVLEDPEFKKVYKKNIEVFTERILELKSLPSVKEVRVQGLFAGVDTTHPNLATLWNKFLDEGLFVFVKADLLVLAPPLNLETATLIRGLDAVERILKSIS